LKTGYQSGRQLCRIREDHNHSATLSKEAQATLDKFAETASGLKGGYMVEIRGFSDSTGPETYNIAFSNSRADKVQRCLMSKGVPLYRISVLG
jgi:outer membrane protein OmpA-like peptidoglycan-associated protein